MSLTLGATFDESAVDPGQDAQILERLYARGLRDLELAIHNTLLNTDRADRLTAIGRALGFSFAFHAPDFADPENFDLAYLMSSSSSKKAFGEWMDRCSDYGPGIRLIVHGGLSANETLRFFDWALERVERTRGGQILLLENTFSATPSKCRFGQNVDDLMLLMTTFDGSHAGLCLDTAHWIRSVHQGQFPNVAENNCETSLHVSPIPEMLIPWIERVHVHEVDALTGIDHQGISESGGLTSGLLAPWLGTQQGINPTCVISLEILNSSLVMSGRLQNADWISTLELSLDWLSLLSQEKIHD
jgi:hypothetical protein